VQIAYQVTGEGPIDLVWAPATMSNLEVDWGWPPKVRLIEGLSAFARLIRFDKRGTGMSDRPTDAATLEERTDDIRAVMDSVGTERAAILGFSEGGSMALMFGAMYPARTQALVIVGCQARWTQTADYPWGPTADEQEAVLADIRANWPSMQYLFGPGAGMGDDVDPDYVAWVLRWAQMGGSPRAIVALEEMIGQIDVRDVLPTIAVPTLVINRTGDPVADVDAARALAAAIPGARFVEFPGNNHSMFDMGDEFIAEVRTFLTGVRAPAPTTRRLATLLFVDVVGSTALATSMGDSRWRDLLDRYYARVGAELASFGGVEVDRAGDGLLATFDGPTRAIRCAQALVRLARELGLQLRAGIHTGEVETAGQGVRGIAVHVAARVAALADADEVLVSGTVRDLIAGSGIELEDRGFHELKGVQGAREVLAVR
jgi:class 3 adenylate cyclase/pimeloyl-ACP methyl ester carboxylesterase